MSPILQIQRRMMELGRIRLGEKGPKGEPKKRSTFRLTSASQTLLEEAARLYGGTVQPWQGGPEEGLFELGTDATELDILLPPVLSMQDGSPTLPYSQWFELWSGGGCERRCDGETELITGKACLCDPDDRACQPTTRVSVMLPRVPGVGVWRLETHGWNAATTLPGTLELLRLAAEGNRFIPAVLRLENRTSKRPGEQTRRFVVPVIDLPETRVADMIDAAGVPVAINAPAPERIPRPALPAAADLPADASFGNGEPSPAMGEPPALPPVPDPVADAQDRLLELAWELGVREDTARMIDRNAEQHAGDPSKHAAWLRRQIASAERKLAERGKEPEAEPEQEPMFQAPAGATGHVDHG